MVLRLINDRELLQSISNQIQESDLDENLFTSSAEAESDLAVLFEWVYDNHSAIQADEKRIWTVSDRNLLAASPA